MLASYPPLHAASVRCQQKHGAVRSSDGEDERLIKVKV
jgi:hypothetical protein